MQFFRLRSARKRKEAMNRQEAIVAWVGIDWADESHQVCEYEVGTGNKQIYAVEQNAESLQEWINQLRIRHGGGKRIAVVLEQARGGLIYALMSTDFIEIYPVNPQSLAKFRKALYPSGAKSDPVDAELLEEMVRQNPGRFRAWVPGDAQTRSLQLLTEGVMMVRTLVGQIEPLRAAVEKYDVEIARIFQQHPDRAVFESFPGAGKVLAPRLTAAFGADRDRFEAALEIQEFSGIAPVTERSGKTIWVHRRWACPKFVLQTFHEFADQARKFCAWSKLYYQQQRAHGKEHHAAVRALAYKWIRIMFRCWKDHKPYDDSRYMKSLVQRGSPLAAGWSQQPVRSVEI